MAHFYIGFGLIAADKKGSVNRIRFDVVDKSLKGELWPIFILVLV